MRQLTTREILNVWEQGLSQPLLQRALILLVAACPELQTESLARLSIGQRDRRLLQLRQQLFGNQLVNTTICPHCEERIEWVNKVDDLLIIKNEELQMEQEFEMNEQAYSLNFRLPNSIDLAEVIELSDSEKIQQRLLSRCLNKIEYSGRECQVTQLPKSVLEKLSQQIEKLDPQAEIRINLVCPACDHHWDVLFDIANFLWLEINEWAERMLNNIHKLATAYGWTEGEILDLSPVRRQLYLGMVG